MVNPKIIHANIQDTTIATQLHALQRTAYAVESVLIDYPQLPPLHESVEQLQAADERWLVYMDQSEIAGAVAYRNLDDTLDICRMIVSPTHFRRGIGRALLNALEEREPTMPRLIVSTAEQNEPAIALYEKQGFHIYERITLPDGLRLVHLQKQRA